MIHRSSHCYANWEIIIIECREMESLGTAVVEETKTQTWSGIFFRVYILLTAIYLTHVMPRGLSQKSFNNVILSKWKLLPSILPFPIFQALEVIPMCYFFWYHNRSTCSVIHLSVTFPSSSSGEPSIALWLMVRILVFVFSAVGIHWKVSCCKETPFDLGN